MNKENALIFENYMSSMINEEHDEGPVKDFLEGKTAEDLLNCLKDNDEELYQQVEDHCAKMAEEKPAEEPKEENESESEDEVDVEAGDETKTPAFISGEEDSESEEKEEYSEEEMEEANQLINQLRDLKKRSGVTKVEEQLNVIKATQPALFEKVSCTLMSSIIE
jgi:hypothetical protein